MTVKKRPTKMDPKLVASKQKYEISYLAEKFNASTAVVNKACKINRGRGHVEAYLKALGYIAVRKKKK